MYIVTSGTGVDVAVGTDVGDMVGVASAAWTDVGVDAAAAVGAPVGGALDTLA